MDDLGLKFNEAYLADMGWKHVVLASESITLSGNATGSKAFVADPARVFRLMRMSVSKTGAFTMQVTTDQGEPKTIIPSGMSNGLFFLDSNAPVVPREFKREISPKEQLTLTFTDTSGSSNTIIVLFDGWLSP